MTRIDSTDAHWPGVLSALAGDEPPQLWWHGDPWVDRAAAVAIVGSRRATAAGMAIAHDMARELARQGIVIVSGFARGIDEAAHMGAVAVGGVTIAVLGCGIGIDYPRGRDRLRAALLARGGAEITEFPPDTEPRPFQFPQRNRIIAALATAVVVVEATERSGALSTARWAVDLGREVLAVPGPLHSPQSRGTNRLIRDGARPCLETADVLDALGLAAVQQDFVLPASDPIVDLLRGGPVHPDSLLGHVEGGAASLATRLAELEMSGAIRSLPGGLVEAVR